MQSSTLKDVAIGSTVVGATHPPLILPDIDMFFNGDLCVAEHLIQCVKDAGLSTIKAAILEDYDIVFDNGAQEGFLDNDGQAQKVNYRELIHKKILSREQHIALFDMIRAVGLECIVSVYDIPSVYFASEQGAVALKIPSSNITHRPLIEVAAATSLPLIIDTGKATLPEMTRALTWARRAGAGDQILVEHSPLAPPAPVERQDLSMIPYLRHTLGLHTGLSHHARGPLMMLASVPLGAAIIECGLCQDDEPADQDVYHALRASELGPAVAQIHEIHAAMGNPYHLSRHDIIYHQARMSLRAKGNLPAGAEINLQNIAFSFPPIGIPAENWTNVEGKRLHRPIAAGQPVVWNDLV